LPPVFEREAISATTKNENRFYSDSLNQLICSDAVYETVEDLRKAVVSPINDAFGEDIVYLAFSKAPNARYVLLKCKW